MIEKLSFSEYCKAKELLRAAADTIPQTLTEYELTKYCKFPVIFENEGDKQYITFKPKDKIEILWEHLDPANPVPVSITVTTSEESALRVRAAWSNKKLNNWVNKTTIVAD